MQHSVLRTNKDPLSHKGSVYATFRSSHDLCSFSACLEGYVRREFMQRLSAVLHGTLVPTSATLCMRAVLMLRHALMSLGLVFFYLLCFLPLFFPLLMIV
jgi:hypothetical protein